MSVFKIAKEAGKALERGGKKAVKAAEESPYKLKEKPPKPPTKKELAAQARAESEGRTISTYKLKKGENRQPFINPSAKEKAAIRKQYGPGIQGKEGPETIVDPAAIGDILPAAGPRTRPQADLQRRPPPGVPAAKWAGMIANPAVRARIIEAAKAGESVADWYDTTSLQKAFHNEFGPEEGQRRYEDYIGMVAGTSTGSKIGQNIKIASNYFSQKYGGGRDPGVTPYLRRNREKPANPDYYEVPPEGYGADKQQTHMHNVNTLGLGGGLSPENNPKIAAFNENLLGNWQPTTIDKHAIRLGAMASRDPRFLSEQGQAAFAQMSQAGLDQNAAIENLLKQGTNWIDAIPQSEYAAVEAFWDDIAKEMNIAPAQLQAQAWVGGGKQTGLGSPGVTFMDAFKDRIRRTSIRDNIPPDQVLKLMLHGKLTLAELEPSQQDVPGGTMIG